jgi:hypothetical protein
MVDLPTPIPSNIAGLPRDDRGFPIPWFVQWIEEGRAARPGIGHPDFRVMDAEKFALALRQPRCWVCGQMLGRHRVFVIGPMCSVNRVISEPPLHRECAEWSVKACPFLARPRMRRNTKDVPEDAQGAPGFHIDRNPGVMCLWETPTYKPFRVNAGNEGVLIRLGEPERVDWYAEGRAATRTEVEAALESGLPALLDVATKNDGPEGVKALQAMRARVDRYLPAAW